MNIKEIKQAVTELSPNELARFRRWFDTYYLHALKDHKERKHRVEKLKGSLKGKGLLKSLMADKDFEKNTK